MRKLRRWRKNQLRSFDDLTLPAPVPPNFFVRTVLRNRWSSLDVIAAMLVDLEQKNFDDFFSLERQNDRPVLVFCCLWGLCENHLFSIIPYTSRMGDWRNFVTDILFICSTPFNNLLTLAYIVTLFIERRACTLIGPLVCSSRKPFQSRSRAVNFTQSVCHVHSFWMNTDCIEWRKINFVM